MVVNLSVLVSLAGFFSISLTSNTNSSLVPCFLGDPPLTESFSFSEMLSSLSFFCSRFEK